MEIYRRPKVKMVSEGLIEICPSFKGEWAVAKGQKIREGDLLGKFSKSLDETREIRSKFAAAVGDIVENQSLLLRVPYLSFPARLAAKTVAEGELQILEDVEALTSRDWAGKILLFQGSLSSEVLVKAQALAAVGAVVGSLDWGSFRALSARGFGLLVLEGLGNWRCSGEVWRVLESVAGLVGHIAGERGELLVPNPKVAKSELPEPEEGMLRLRAGQAVRILKGNFEADRVIWKRELEEEFFVQAGNVLLD